MAAPTKYQRVYSFTNFQSTSPALPLPGNKVDAELNAVKTSLNQVIDALALIQRSDGAVANGTIGADQLTSDIQALLGIGGASLSGAYVDLTGVPAAIDAIDGLTPAADKLAYYTGASAAALTDLTSFARTILDDIDAPSVRTTLGLVIGTHVQAYDADLAAIAAGTAIPQEATPASGDFLLMLDAGGVWRKVDWSDLPGVASGLADVVEDVTPQLGGDLDANSFNIGFDDGTGVEDDSGNEVLIFQKNASAVNYAEIENAATGNAVKVRATGDDADVHLDLITKGSGVVRVNGTSLASIYQALDADLTEIAAGTAIPQELTPAAGDFLLMQDAGGTWRRVDWSDLPGAAGGIANVVEDVTPQLGGDLDLNTHVITGMVIGTNVQAWDAQLDSLSAASANGVSLVTAANYAAMRTLLDLEAGTDFYSKTAADAAFQPIDADLTAIAAGLSIPQELTPASGDFLLMLDAGGTWRIVDWADLPSASGGVATDEQTFNTSGTWTKPAGAYTEATVEIWGAGGSGGRRAVTTENAVGGCGGSYVRVTFPLSALGATETVTIGAGGAAVTTGDANGNAGGTTSFGSWISMTGGGGGGQAASGNVAAASVGSASLNAAISELATASNNVTSTVANDASARVFAAGAGGSICGQNSDDGNAGASTLAGAGGAGSRAASGNATSGSAPGGGGGAKCGAAGNSGAGAAGRVKVTCR